jgi:hypothetical protein
MVCLTSQNFLECGGIFGTGSQEFSLNAGIFHGTPGSFPKAMGFSDDQPTTSRNEPTSS